MIEQLTDTWRWWAAMGALLAMWPVAKWLYTFDPATTPDFSDTLRWILGLGLLMALIAILIAGAVIPWASDGRIAGFGPDSPIFRQAIASAWLFWGLCAWTTAVGFARRRWPMIAASVLWWWAMWFVLRETAGAQL